MSDEEEKAAALAAHEELIAMGFRPCVWWWHEHKIHVEHAHSAEPAFEVAGGPRDLTLRATLGELRSVVAAMARPQDGEG